METNADILEKIKTLPETHGYTPAELGNCFNYFMRQNDPGAWKSLATHIDDWEYKPDRENTLLELAVQHKRAEVVDYILTKSPGLITNDKLWCCLFMSPDPVPSEAELHATTTILLAAGLTIDTPGSENNNAFHELFTVGIRQKINCTFNEDDFSQKLSLLLSGSNNLKASLNHLDNAEQTPFLLACSLGNYKAVKKIINHRPDLRAAPGMQALGALIENNDLTPDADRILKLLIKNNVDPDKENRDLIVWAANSINTMKYVIAQGYEIQTRRGVTSPLLVAAGNNDLEMAEYLINQHNIEVNTDSAYEEDTALIIALDNQCEEMAWLLLENDADVNVMSSKGLSATELAKLKCSKELAKKIGSLRTKNKKLNALLNLCPEVTPGDERDEDEGRDLTAGLEPYERY